MFYYFGYGSNMNSQALKAKGVSPETSEVAILHGWKLAFNLQHWFRHEGGMANIEQTNDSNDVVEGVLHLFKDHELKSLDQMEAYGIGYDRIKLTVKTNVKQAKSLVYIALPQFKDNSLLPTNRYKNIIIKGAKEHSLSDAYIEKLEQLPTFKMPTYPKFKIISDQINRNVFTKASLLKRPFCTSLYGYVFDMRNARSELSTLFDIFGGKDMTLFHLKRIANSKGTETYEEVLNGNISKEGKAYINTYLHEYNKEFECIGRYSYLNETKSL